MKIFHGLSDDMIENFRNNRSFTVTLAKNNTLTFFSFFKNKKPNFNRGKKIERIQKESKEKEKD